MAYTYKELIEGYRDVGVAVGRIVYVVSEFWRLREFERPGEQAVAQAHWDALWELLGPKGTLVVSTASTNLIGTDILFDPATTPSKDVGFFSEFVRQQPGARRSLHPFVSYTAVGPMAEAITADVSRHAFGPESPEARLCELDARLVSVGMQPNYSCSTAHHVEQVCGVPFRYIKEFVHPVIRSSQKAREEFYLHVWYRDSGMVKDRYKKLFERLVDKLEIKEATIGRGRIFGYSMADFYREACRIVVQEPYISCKALPSVRTYRS
jgi:aminoglycoside 3-N-acetyltransferase